LAHRFCNHERSCGKRLIFVHQKWTFLFSSDAYQFGAVRRLEIMQQFDSAHAKETPATQKRSSIVVFDANAISLLTMAGMLDGQGYSCICARDHAAAISAMGMGTQDLLVCDVGDDVEAALATLEEMRATSGHEELPAVLIADSQWAGLEKKVEAMKAATRCLFKPIDPNALLAVVDHLLWMPSLVAAHRRRGTRPDRSGWITL
jgi:CheY-like chemotaxis protein